MGWRTRAARIGGMGGGFRETSILRLQATCPTAQGTYIKEKEQLVADIRYLQESLRAVSPLSTNRQQSGIGMMYSGIKVNLSCIVTQA